MGNATEETLRAILGKPASATIGSLSASQAAQQLSATSAKFSGGVFVYNSDTSLSFFVGGASVTAAVGAGKICVGPGQGIPYLASNDPSLIYVIAASGAPIVNWQAIET